MNLNIRVKEVRVIDEKGGQLGVFPTSNAIKLAEEAGLDLVEVSPNAKPPVCKIIDYGKYKYWKKKKEHEAKKHQTVIHVKEVKFRPRIDIHDFGVKMRRIREFLEEGNKVKATVMFRGREMAYRDQGVALLKRVSQGVHDIGKVEMEPKREGYVMVMILASAKSKP